MGQVIAASNGTLVAHFEKIQPGNDVLAAVSLSAGNRYRFSTKYFDEEVNLYYYGFRYYSSELGRWMRRDPIGEIGATILRVSFIDQKDMGAVEKESPNTYSYVRNNLPNYYDYLGLFGDSGHSIITTNAIIDYGASSERLDIVIKGNLYVDRGGNFFNNNEHSIRNWFQSKADARLQSDIFRKKQIRLAIEAIMNGKCKESLFELGQGLHNIQDEIAHKYGTLMPFMFNVVFIGDSHLNPIIIYRDSYPTNEQLDTATRRSKEYVKRYIQKINCNPFKNKDSVFAKGLNRSCCCND